MAGATCPNCGKHFRFAESIAKYHGWCKPKGTAPTVTLTNVRVDPLQLLLTRAEDAGMAAASAHRPTPMHVVEHVNPLDDNSPVALTYPPVTGGVCGFAWVTMKGNTRLAKAVRARYDDPARHATFARLRAHKGYPTGLNVWVGGFGQSMTTKEAFAQAYAQVLRDAGHEDVYAESRMD